jgi:hypothetical protein
MASARYTRNINPEELQNTTQSTQPMSRQKKWENFWFYYKWHVLGGVLAVVLVCMFVKDVFFQTKADYTIGVLTRTELPYGVAEQLQQGFETLLDDANGDGTVSVLVSEYVIAGENAVDAQTQMAAVTRLMGDMESGQVMLFLTDDPAYFEDLYGIFAYNDGTTPTEGEAVDWARMGVSWADCPALSAVDWGEITLLDGTDYGAVQAYMNNFTFLLRMYEGSGLEGKQSAQQAHQRAAEMLRDWMA